MKIVVMDPRGMKPVSLWNEEGLYIHENGTFLLQVAKMPDGKFMCRKFTDRAPYHEWDSLSQWDVPRMKVHIEAISVTPV